mmetsp:Transcript_14216/g.21012  ORF Transcript_14216/g.21012 Transcript_14216/m.21012 type:complete len:177 (+) Transcript_14216:45-575(+)
MQAAPPTMVSSVSEAPAPTVLHFSDTHNMHYRIEEHFVIPKADIFLHTGDFTDNGSPQELANFVKWLTQISERFKHMLLIPGNHDWYTVRHLVGQGNMTVEEALSPGFYNRLLQSYGLPSNARVLDHEEVVVEGLRIFGSGWCPWNPCSKSDGVSKHAAQMQLAAGWQAKQRAPSL